MNKEFSLLDATDSVLVVIDVQDKFLDRLDKTIADQIVSRICWLVQLANWLDIPIIVTAEEIDSMGPTNDRIRSYLPSASPDLNKLVFGLAGQSDILDVIQKTARKTAVLVGLETDVCVLQSAFGLEEKGFRTAVVSDACASPQTGHEYGLDRMRSAGITLVSTKGLFFEWVLDVEKCHDFFRKSGIRLPEELYIG